MNKKALFVILASFLLVSLISGAFIFLHHIEGWGDTLNEECMLHLEVDERWAALFEFGFEYNLSEDVETCGLMSIHHVTDYNLINIYNLQEFTDLIASFYCRPSRHGGFTDEGAHLLLEELGLLEIYFELLEDSINKLCKF